MTTFKVAFVSHTASPVKAVIKAISADLHQLMVSAKETETQAVPTLSKSIAELSLGTTWHATCCM